MTIVKLEPSKHVPERWLVWFEDGSLLRVGEGEVVRFALYQGMELSDALYDEISACAQSSAVRSRAMELLSRRPMSKKELLDKLTAPTRGGQRLPATREQAQEAAAWLEELGYLNDAAYAGTVVRHYSALGYGERKLTRELLRRGVPREYWQQALTQAPDGREGVDAFLEKRFRSRAPDRKELKRAGDALARRGYRWEEIREGLNRYGAGILEEE